MAQKEKEELLRKLLSDHAEGFELFREEAQKGNQYYQNRDDITKTGAAAIQEVNQYLKKLGKNPLRSADNRIPLNWHRIITDQKIGYLFTYPPQFDVKGKPDREARELMEKITECIGDEYPKVMKQLGIDATNCGRAWMAYWYPKAGSGFEYYFANPDGILPVYENASLKRKMTHLIRRYHVTENGKKFIRCELWDEREVSYFKSQGAGYAFERTERHSYGEIPFIEFRNNETAAGDLVMYKSLVDSMDKLISGFANDTDDIQEIIWVIKNYAGETSETDYDENGNEIAREIDPLQRMKAKKWVNVDENGGVDLLRGEIPYEARSKYLEILTNQLYISAMAVNPFPDAIGQASGVYIDFLYSLLELKAGLMETEFRSGLAQFLRAILRYLGADPKTKIEQSWTRNKPRNDQEIAQIIASTPNTVLSDESKTKAHPLTEDWATEREQIEKEQKDRVKNYMDELTLPHG